MPGGGGRLGRSLRRLERGRAPLSAQLARDALELAFVPVEPEVFFVPRLGHLVPGDAVLFLRLVLACHAKPPSCGGIVHPASARRYRGDAEITVGVRLQTVAWA